MPRRLPDASYRCLVCGAGGHWTNTCAAALERLPAEERDALAGESKAEWKRALKRQRWRLSAERKKGAGGRGGGGGGGEGEGGEGGDEDGEGEETQKEKEERQRNSSSDSSSRRDSSAKASDENDVDREDSDASTGSDESSAQAAQQAARSERSDVDEAALRRRRETPWKDNDRPSHELGRLQRRLRTLELGAQGVKVVLDLSYTDAMSDAEQRSLKSQVVHAYGDNTRRAAPLNLILTSVAGPTEAMLRTQSGFPESWSVTVHARHFAEVLPAEAIVVLSPDASDVLTTLDRDTYYIIGGLVDRTLQVGRSLGRAQARQLATARLPLAEHVTLARSNRLPINHVASILADVAATGDWAAAFLRHIPKARPVRAPPAGTIDGHGTEHGGS